MCVCFILSPEQRPPNLAGTHIAHWLWCSRVRCSTVTCWRIGCISWWSIGGTTLGWGSIRWIISWRHVATFIHIVHVHLVVVRFVVQVVGSCVAWKHTARVAAVEGNALKCGLPIFKNYWSLTFRLYWTQQILTNLCVSKLSCCYDSHTSVTSCCQCVQYLVLLTIDRQHQQSIAQGNS